MSQKALSFDLGGTKIAAAIVNHKGEILEQELEPARFEEGKGPVLRQLVAMGRRLLLKHPAAKRVGVASAGPLDWKAGVLLNPTNFKDASGKGWGKVKFSSFLEEKFQRPCQIDNDAAAALLAETWIGSLRSVKNGMILTLGTGLGTGVLCNGELVRSGRFLHTEAGHLPLRAGDPLAPCGCGRFGCAEAFLSGRNFAKRVSQKLSKNLTALEICDLARKGNSPVLQSFQEYSELLAQAISGYAYIYSPEKIVLSGSFADAKDLFLPQTIKILGECLHRSKELIPRVVGSELKNTSGLLGGAYLAFFGHTLVRSSHAK